MRQPCFDSRSSGTRPAPPNRRRSWSAALAVASLCLLTGAGLGCGKRAEPPASGGDAATGSGTLATVEPGKRAAESPRLPLRCEEEGYPCAWSEVDAAVVAETDRLAREAVGWLDQGASAGAVAVRLAALDAVESVATDGRMVRFRMRAGRPVWVAEASPELFDTRGFASPASAQTAPPSASGPDDPIGENPPGRKPWKKALILSPFQWHFGDDEAEELQRLLGVGLVDDQDPYQVRDYRCGEGGRCVEVKANDLVNLAPDNELYCPQNPGTCPMGYGVERSDFKTWRGYDLIHVGTHGFRLCGTADPEEVVQWLSDTQSVAGSRDLAGTSAKLVSGACLVALASGRIYPDGSIPAGSVSDPGVEYLYVGMGGMEQHCVGAPQGSNRWIQQYCGQPFFLLEILADDFFSAVYGGGLRDKLIFLNACSSLADRGIAQALSSGESMVIGWSLPVPMTTAVLAAKNFYEVLLKRGEPAVDAWYHAASEVTTSFPGGLELDAGWRTWLPPGVAEQLLGATELEGRGSEARRGREMVSLRWPGSDEELQDGARIPAPGGSDECTPDLGLVLEGIPEGQDPAALPLRLSANGATLEGAYVADRPSGPGRFRHDGPIRLPPGLDPEQPVDLEIWAELPRGGQSRWRYEDLRIRCGCGFDATVAGFSRRGRTEGIWAVFSTRGQPGMMGGIGGGVTAETKEDLLAAFKMVQAPGGAANPLLEKLSEKWQKEIDEEKGARPAGGGTLTLSLVESSEGQAGPPGGNLGTAFKLDAFSERALEPGFTGTVPLTKLAVHTGEFASEGLGPMVYRFDPAIEPGGDAQLVVDSYDGSWMEGTVTANLMALPGIQTLAGARPRIRVTARFTAGLFNPLRMENVCLMGQ